MRKSPTFWTKSCCSWRDSISLDLSGPPPSKPPLTESHLSPQSMDWALNGPIANVIVYGQFRYNAFDQGWNRQDLLNQCGIFLTSHHQGQSPNLILRQLRRWRHIVLLANRLHGWAQQSWRLWQVVETSMIAAASSWNLTQHLENCKGKGAWTSVLYLSSNLHDISWHRWVKLREHFAVAD